jgi:hypothetical protein
MRPSGLAISVFCGRSGNKKGPERDLIMRTMAIGRLRYEASITVRLLSTTIELNSILSSQRVDTLRPDASSLQPTEPRNSGQAPIAGVV